MNDIICFKEFDSTKMPFIYDMWASICILKVWNHMAFGSLLYVPWNSASNDWHKLMTLNTRQRAKARFFTNIPFEKPYHWIIKYKKMKNLTEHYGLYNIWKDTDLWLSLKCKLCYDH